MMYAFSSAGGPNFVIDRGMGKEITREEAMEILDRAEAAGLVHCTSNRQEIDFSATVVPVTASFSRGLWLNRSRGLPSIQVFSHAGTRISVPHVKPVLNGAPWRP